MSEPILPLEVWPEGIFQARVPVNDNFLRVEAMSRPCLGVANDAAGGDADGDVWLVGSAPTGAFAAFDENDIALYHVDPDTAVAAWYAWAPVEGLRLVVNDVRKVYMDGSTASWEDDPSITGGGGGSTRDDVTSVSSSSGVVTLNYALGDYFTLTLTENVTSWVVSNPPGAGKGFTLMVQLTQGAGPYTVANPGTVPGGTMTVSTGSGDIDLLAISSFDNGTTLRSNLANDYS